MMEVMMWYADGNGVGDYPVNEDDDGDDSGANDAVDDVCAIDCSEYDVDHGDVEHDAENLGDDHAYKECWW